MSYEAKQRDLQDILECIDAIELYLSQITLPIYQADGKTKKAVERDFQGLSEDAFRSGDDADKLCPGVDWRKIRGLGKFLRHEYDQIEDEVLWDAAQRKLPPLRTAARKAIESMQAAANAAQGPTIP